MAFDESKCEDCPIRGEYVPVEPTGEDGARFLVITDVPSQSGAREGRLLPPMSMKVLGGEMIKNGFSREDFRFYPACRCAYDQNGYTNKTKKAIHKHCREHLLDEIEEQEPEALIPLGAEATTQAFGRDTKITKVRGMPHTTEELGAPIFPLSSPGIVVRYPQNAPLFAADVQSFARFVNNDFDAAASAAVEHGKYTIVDDLQFLIDRNEEVVSFDMEATGLRWYKGGVDVRTYDPAIHKGNPDFSPRFQILTMQFTTKAGEGYMLVWDHPEAPIDEAQKPRMRNQIRKLLCDQNRIVIGHNVKFDNVALWMKEDIRFRITGDTLMLTALLDENATEKNLDVMTKIHVPEMAGYADHFNATVDKSRMWEVPLDKMRAYGCGDTDAAYRLYTKLEEIIASDEKLWSHYCNVSIPGLNALAGMETRGMFIDVERQLRSFQAYMEVEVERQYNELIAQVPREIKRKHIELRKGDVAAALSFGNKEFVKDILFYHKKGFRLKPKVFTDTTKNLPDHLKQPSTSSKNHLPYFFETCPFTFQLSEYVQNKRLLDTNVVGFNNKYVVGGKVRPLYSLTKTVTGRTSSEDPNGQNYPKRSKLAKEYRKMFVPPPGYYVAELDLSQAELRIAASMANDPTMIQIYKDEGDIHTATALVVLGLTEAQFQQLPKSEQKLARTKAKSVNFGFLYGMGWRNFISFAKTQYGVEFTEKEAKRIREGFFRKYSKLPAWHNRMREFARRYKFVRSYSGRIRHLPMIDSDEEYIQQEAERQAINSPVQEFGSSLGVMALGRMNEEINPEYLQIVGFIHDAIVVYVKKEYLDWGLRTVKTYMESNPVEEWFGTTLRTPIVADCGFGLNLGDIIELPGFKLDKAYDYRATGKDGERVVPIDIPRQQTPPNNGRLTRSAYTTPEDLEPEDVQPATRRLVRRISRQSKVLPETPAKKRYTRTRKEKV